MPGISGPDLAEQMMKRFPSIAVVLLSGYTAETLHLEAVLAAGATFLAKPFNPQELVRTVATAIEGSRQRKSVEDFSK
jgi:FixJ family two-component response regulator